MKRSELAGARWDDIDFDFRTLRLTCTKSGGPRLVPLPSAATELLRSLPSFGSYEYVFPGTLKTGHLVEVKGAWRRLCRKAGLSDVTIHDLRRTVGSRMAIDGVNLPTIGWVLGHVDLNATQIYARLDIDGPMPPDRSHTQSSCGTAKFKECSDCGQIVIRNESSEVINPQIEVDGLGFDHGDSGLLKLACKKGSGALDSCYEIAPGQNCFSSIHFCPEQSGISRGQVKVTAGSGSTAKVTIFSLVGTADYSSELQAADAVRRRHLPELMAIPKVERVSLDQSGGKILIEVEQNLMDPKLRRTSRKSNDSCPKPSKGMRWK